MNGEHRRVHHHLFQLLELPSILVYLKLGHVSLLQTHNQKSGVVHIYCRHSDTTLNEASLNDFTYRFKFVSTKDGELEAVVGFLVLDLGRHKHVVTIGVYNLSIRAFNHPNVALAATVADLHKSISLITAVSVCFLDFDLLLVGSLDVSLALELQLLLGRLLFGVHGLIRGVGCRCKG